VAQQLRSRGGPVWRRVRSELPRRPGADRSGCRFGVRFAFEPVGDGTQGLADDQGHMARGGDALPVGKTVRVHDDKFCGILRGGLANGL